MNEKQNYRFTYQVEAEALEKVLLLISELSHNTGMDPVTLTLADGKVIPYNGYAAHQFAGEGRITKKEFIEICENP